MEGQTDTSIYGVTSLLQDKKYVLLYFSKLLCMYNVHQQYIWFWWLLKQDIVLVIFALILFSDIDWVATYSLLFGQNKFRGGKIYWNKNNTANINVHTSDR